MTTEPIFSALSADLKAVSTARQGMGPKTPEPLSATFSEPLRGIGIFSAGFRHA